MDLLKNSRSSSLHMKLMDFLNKSIEVLEKQIKHGVNFQKLGFQEKFGFTLVFPL